MIGDKVKRIFIIIAISFGIYLIGVITGGIYSYIKYSKPDVIVNNYTVDSLTDYDLVRLAIIKTESDYNSLAVGKTSDIGIYQITPIYVKAVNQILKDTVYHHNDAFDIESSICMVNIIQDYYNPNHNVTDAIRLHNPKGDAIGYSQKVLKNMEYIKQYENIRRLLIEYND